MVLEDSRALVSFNPDHPHAPDLVAALKAKFGAAFIASGTPGRSSSRWPRTLRTRTRYQHDWANKVAPSDNYGGMYWLVGVDGWCVLDAQKQAFMTSWPCRGAIEGAWFVPKYMGPAGVFLRGDVGRNPLNIRFAENRNEIIFGLMIDTSQSIARLPPPAER